MALTDTSVKCLEYSGYYTHITHFKNSAFRPHSIYVACHFVTTNPHFVPNTVNRYHLQQTRYAVQFSRNMKVRTTAKLSLTTPRRYIDGGEVWPLSLTCTLGGGKWPTSGFGQLTPEKQPQYPLNSRLDANPEPVWSFWNMEKRLVLEGIRNPESAVVSLCRAYGACL
jgi:hypothetical protein